MDLYRVTVLPSSRWTRLLVTHGPDELLRAALPPPSSVSHERAVATFLEGLALWLDARLLVVLSVGDADACSGLGLADERGVGIRSLFYQVQVTEPVARRGSGDRIRGVGESDDPRQLALVLDPQR